MSQQCYLLLRASSNVNAFRLVVQCLDAFVQSHGIADNFTTINLISDFKPGMATGFVRIRNARSLKGAAGTRLVVAEPA